MQPHPCRFLRQRPIDAYIVDFYCASRKLVIEIDGDSHFQNGAQEYDQARTSVLEGYGLKVLRFTNPDVLNHFEQVCQQIQAALDDRC
ncbi:MAG TPA: endonuclease domain-containing protein [Anaerolineaceae bacterium]